MKKTVLYRLICIFILVPMISGMISCAKLESIINSVTGDSEETEKTEDGNADSAMADSATGNTSGIASDSGWIFSVNGKRVTIGEWNLYARPRYEEIEGLYSEEVWNYEVNAEGKKFSEAFLEDVKDEIRYTKIVASQAEKLGVELTDDDNIEINIETADYMSRLSDELRNRYGITEADVRQVYADNLLALKVYEKLTLNISTDTDEKEVRHMVLQYIMIPKTFENKSGDTEYYTDAELEVFRNRLKNLKAYMVEHFPITLKEAETQDLSAVEIVADLAQLQEQLPEDMAGVAFWLREGEVSEVYETEDAFFLFCCVKDTDPETTNEAKIKVLESREKEVFDAAYSGWMEESVLEINEDSWKKLKEDMK